MATPEEQKKENDRQVLVAYRWKAKHPEFKETEENVQKIKTFLEKNYGGADKHFTEENLEKAFQLLKFKLDLYTSQEIKNRAAEIRAGLNPPKVTIDSPFAA